jgi:hypothetical protein
VNSNIRASATIGPIRWARPAVVTARRGELGRSPAARAVGLTAESLKRLWHVAGDYGTVSAHASAQAP